jgi:hypothetical protein
MSQASILSLLSFPFSPLQAAWVRPALLSDELCREYIAAAEARSWRGSAVVEAAGWTRHVTNASPDIDECELAEAVRPCVPARLCSLSYLSVPRERIVFLRYGVDEHFSTHTDAAYLAAPGQRSLFAMLVYLNADFYGGETYFPDLGLTVKPEAGTALFIAHGLRHEGLKVRSGVKFAFHSYVVYGRSLVVDAGAACCPMRPG